MQILRQAQYLRHAQYGLGVVKESNAERTAIDFDLHGIKKFVTSLMQVELLPGAAPNRPAPSKRLKKKTAAAAAVAPAKTAPR